MSAGCKLALALLLLCGSLAFAQIPCSNTPPITNALGLNVPIFGTTPWAVQLNQNFSCLDNFLSGYTPLPALWLSGYQDMVEISQPPYPPTGRERWYASLSTHTLSCITSVGNSCAPSGGGGGTITAVVAGTGLSGGGTSGSVTLNIASTAVSVGSYTCAGFTVNAQGQLTSASNGSCGSSLTVNGGSAIPNPNLQNGTGGNAIGFTASGSNIQATIQAGAVTNAMLLNASTTVNSQTCALGGNCTVPGTISGLTAPYIPVAISATAIGNSQLQDSSGTLIYAGNAITIGTPPAITCPSGANCLGFGEHSTSGFAGVSGADAFIFDGLSTLVSLSGGTPYVPAWLYPLQGSDSNVMTSGTISASAAISLCTDSNHGITTSGCPATGVSSVFTRTGAVTAAAGDYTQTQITPQAVATAISGTPSSGTIALWFSNSGAGACTTVPISGGSFTVTLVVNTSQPASGLCIHLINYGTGTITVARNGQNINGGTSSLTIAAGSATAPLGLWVVSDGTNYDAVP